jgi:dTDP-4-dehydrorhamnose 3,5-epimerase
MRFRETRVHGAFLIDLDRREDKRGFFARSWCTKEFEAHGLNPRVVQINVGYTEKKAGIRGLHFQLPPHEEAKTVRCTRGAIFDVVVDLRPDSPTFRQWAGHEITAENHQMLYVPEGCAHGYQTLMDATEMEYTTSALYAPDAARGVRFDDPAFDIRWPLQAGAVSDADRSWQDYVLPGGTVDLRESAGSLSVGRKNGYR